MAASPDYKFRPTDERLINHYLRLKMLGHDNEVTVIPEIDVTSVEPWDIPPLIPNGSNDHVWHFFCHVNQNGRVSRRANAGFWKPTGKVRQIEDIGTKRTLLFYQHGDGNHGVRSDWIMQEYSPDFNFPVQSDFVVYKLKRGEPWPEVDYKKSKQKGGWIMDDPEDLPRTPKQSKQRGGWISDDTELSNKQKKSNKRGSLPAEEAKLSWEKKSKQKGNWSSEHGNNHWNSPSTPSGSSKRMYSNFSGSSAWQGSGNQWGHSAWQSSGSTYQIKLGSPGWRGSSPNFQNHFGSPAWRGSGSNFQNHLGSPTWQDSGTHYQHQFSASRFSNSGNTRFRGNINWR